MKSTILLLSALLLPMPVYGQAEVPLVADAAPQAAVKPAGPRCLSRAFKDGNGQPQQLLLVAPAEESAGFEAKGFAQRSCAGVRPEELRSRMCRLSLQGNDAVQRQLTSALGASPAAMCKALKAAVPFPVEQGTP